MWKSQTTSLYYRWNTNGTAQGLILVLRNDMKYQNKVEADVFDILMRQLKEYIGVDLRKYYSHSRPRLVGGNFYGLEYENSKFVLPKRYLTTIYHFSKVIFWRITRYQVDIEIRNIKNNEDTFKRIGDLKLQVLNLKRFFDIKNISNDDEMKNFNKSIRKRMGIGNIHENAVTIQNLF